MTTKKSNGALWKRQGQRGEYLSGQLELDGVKHNFRAFVNDYKQTEKQPDYKIFLDEPKDAPKPADQPVMEESDLPF